MGFIPEEEISCTFLYETNVYCIQQVTSQVLIFLNNDRWTKS